MPPRYSQTRTPAMCLDATSATHLACPVYFEQQRQRLECPCHEGGFDVQTGNVLYGPPPRPLDQIVLELRGAEVWAVGRKAGGNERAVDSSEGKSLQGTVIMTVGTFVGA